MPPLCSECFGDLTSIKYCKNPYYYVDGPVYKTNGTKFVCQNCVCLCDDVFTNNIHTDGKYLRCNLCIKYKIAKQLVFNVDGEEVTYNDGVVVKYH